MQKNILLLLISLLVSFLAVEITARYILYKNTPNDLIFKEDIIYTGKPYGILFKVNLNDIGCIGDDVTPLKLDNEKRIFILGGSTTYSRELVDILKTTVSQNNPDYNVKVVSASKPRYTSYNNLTNFKKNLLQYSPDIIVIYLGINDAIYNSFYWINNLPNIGYFNYRSTNESIFFKLLKYHLIDKRLRSNPDFSTGDLRSKQILASNVSSIIEIAQSNNIKVILSSLSISYPTKDSALMKILLEREPPMQHFWGNLQSTVYSVEKHNDIIIELAQQYNLEYVEMNNLIPKELKYFTDICHLTNDGFLILGNQIGNKIGEFNNYSFDK